MKDKWAVVIPSCRMNEFERFYDAWVDYFVMNNVTVFLIEDSDEPTNTEGWFGGNMTRHYCHKDILNDWGRDQRIVGFHSGSIRSYGFWKAYNEGFDYIWTLDDDCYPTGDTDPLQAYSAAFSEKFPVGNYFDVGHTFGLGEYTRGFPFRMRDVASPKIQYGGWDNVPDFDAVTQMKYSDPTGYKFDRKVLAIPTGLGFTGCIMNVAFHRSATKYMYQLVMGIESVGFDRWDDIWSGLRQKKWCDDTERPIVINGLASIKHTRASDVNTNLKKELLGYAANETRWEDIQFIGDSSFEWKMEEGIQEWEKLFE